MLQITLTKSDNVDRNDLGYQNNITDKYNFSSEEEDYFIEKENYLNDAFIEESNDEI